MPSDSAASRMACRAASRVPAGAKTAVHTRASIISDRKRAGFVTTTPPSCRTVPERTRASFMLGGGRVEVHGVSST